MKFRTLFLELAICSALLGASSCVKTNYDLGNSFVLENEKFLTRTISLPLEEMYMEYIDSLTGYSTQRMTLGSIRDERFGITRRGTAFALVPMADSLDWGTNVRITQFHFTAEVDSISCPADEYFGILQNIRVYALEKPLDSTYRYSCELKNSDFAGKPLICLGTPLYDGSDSLTFDFTEAFARTYVREGVNEPIDTLEKYEKEHPGIYICTDDPFGYGGRINFFKVEPSVDDYNYLQGNYAHLKFRADYGDRKDVDTSFIFCFSPTDLTTSATYYAFNSCEHESKEKGYAGKAKDKLYIEGGTGLKPMIRAKYLRELVTNALRDTIEKYGLSDADYKNKGVILNKATLVLPYLEPEDYRAMKFYPQVLNPTLRVSKQDTVYYGGLTDASVSDEDQGEIDRSGRLYKPDIAFHLQQILATTGEDSLRRENIWFMILAAETVVSSSSSDSDYYSQMAYLNYYNNMLAGGGYSSGSAYSNYYNYYMMQELMNSYSSTGSSTVTTTLDKDRYYNAVLNGPETKGDKPRIDITYSFMKKKN